MTDQVLDRPLRRCPYHEAGRYPCGRTDLLKRTNAHGVTFYRCPAHTFAEPGDPYPWVPVTPPDPAR